MTVGLSRTRNGWANQHSVRVRYDNGDEYDVPQDYYEWKQCQPPFDKLPWTNDDA